MKIKFAAVLLATLVFGAVTANTVALLYNLDRIYKALEETPSTLEYGDVYSDIYEDFKRREQYISVTVSVGDLEPIRSAFYDIVGAVESGDEEELIIAKSRLTESILHLRRLCTFSFDSIF